MKMPAKHTGINRRARVLLPLLLAGCLPLTLFAQAEIHVTGAKITEVGIYESKVVTDQTNSVGIKLEGLDNFKLVLSTTNVPARIGITFGFRYEILGTPTNAPIILTMVTKHPPIRNLVTGQDETTDTYPLKSWIGKTYTSCSFDEKSDCVPGTWTFEVWYEGKELCEQSFGVTPDQGSR